jgi:hypothetical protein
VRVLRDGFMEGGMCRIAEWFGLPYWQAQSIRLASGH